MSGGLLVRNVRKRIGTFTLEASFELGPGDRAAIVARSGSGKTTLLKLIAGLTPIDSGEIRLGDKEISVLPPERREIGYVFQDAALFPALSVLENAAFGLWARGVARKEREAQARAWLARVGLDAHRDRAVGALSGGERQRVAFVRALVWKPRLLLLDEPFSALDAHLRAGLRAELLGLLGSDPVPVILVTHDEDEARALATSRIALEEKDHIRTFTKAPSAQR